MADVLVNESSLEDIADAIRSKNGLTTKYKPSEMADAISAISGGGITPTGTKTINITQNGTVTEDVTQYANAQVNVNVPSVSPTGTKQVSITQNGTVTEDVTNYASAEITANVPNSYSASDEGKVVSNGALVAQTSQNITANGTYDTTTKNQITVNVEAVMEKITVSGTSVTQELTANKFYVFGEVTSLTVTLATPTNPNIMNEYHFRFTSGSTATVLTLPQSVTMPSDFAVEASKTYEISIVDGFGTVTAW